ncbi:aminotransferase class I/II-fold pyridoxal phosphate-dependent enzyme [Gammaproteobacteria bacterium]|nr:aminotransferase class I/II-fold pyridoxal phosphate-dependent enzyme [Gammaproteobacteria bacterium]
MSKTSVNHESVGVLESRLEALRQHSLNLDLTRGKPSAEQLALSDSLDGILDGDYRLENGTDARNYGGLRGIPEARRLGAQLLETDPENIIVCGNSSLQAMQLVMDTAMNYGLFHERYSELGSTRAVVPVPGYDRHFTLTESFGIEMISVPMTATGPDMDALEEVIGSDTQCRFLWCVPKYSNPTGCVYDPDTVNRIAALPSKAPGPLLILWDNAYATHDLDFPKKELAPILTFARDHRTEDSIIMFASTSKITFAGGGIAFIGGSENTLKAIEARLEVMTIGPDKVNQLRHAKFLNGRLEDHMAAHARILKPKFEVLERCLQQQLGNRGLATWTRPEGGYFVALSTPPGFAHRVVTMAASAGVALTPAGATFPYGHDPEDSVIRIAPTFASTSEIETAIKVLAVCLELSIRTGS